jgi:hypothetical protein
VIYLLPTVQNKVALTLTENVTLSSPYYLFEITNTQTKVVTTFIAADTSLYTYRYNLFLITVKENPNRLLGEVDLQLGGDYQYNVYEQESSTNLLVADTGDKLENGILVYEKTTETPSKYTRTDKTRAVYTRQG